MIELKLKLKLQRLGALGGNAYILGFATLLAASYTTLHNIDFLNTPHVSLSSLALGYPAYVFLLIVPQGEALRQLEKKAPRCCILRAFCKYFVCSWATTNLKA